jgi:ankyrin repeat protein
MQLLLNAGVDKEATTDSTYTALMIAAQKGNAECTKLLLNAGADTNPTRNDKSTPLMVAAKNGYLQCIKLLLKAGCKVNTLNARGCSALFGAVLNNHVDCVRAIVKAGADITIKVDGKTLDDFADKRSNNDELKAALLSKVGTRRRCEQCGKTTTGQMMMRCGACLTVYYCNRECQTANWPLHKQVSSF